MIHHWQDIVFATGSIVFTIALIPAIIKKQYPPSSTCFMTGGMIFIYAIADFTLMLWVSGVTSIISAIVWIGMGVKQIVRKD